MHKSLVGLLSLLVLLPLACATRRPPVPCHAPVTSPRDHERTVSMQRRSRLVAAAVQPAVPYTSVCQLIIRNWQTYPITNNPAWQAASPGVALWFKTNAPKATIYSSADLREWRCWTQISNVQSNEVRDIGYCPQPGVARMFFKVILHN